MMRQCVRVTALAFGGVSALACLLLLKSCPGSRMPVGFACSGLLLAHSRSACL